MPYYLHFIGLPGSGKTSIGKRVGEQLGVAHKYDLISAGDLSFGLSKDIRLALRYGMRLKKSFRLYDAWAYHIWLKYPKYGEEAAGLYKSFFKHCIAGPDGEHALPALMKSLERDLTFTAVACDYGSSYYDDDGLLQRLVSLFGLRNWQDLDNVFTDNIIKKVQNGGKVVFVNASVQDCLARLSSRKSGVPRLLREYDDIEERLSSAEKYLHCLKKRLLINELEVIEINSSKMEITEGAANVIRSLS